MLSLDPIIDNTDSTLKETYKKVVPQSEEIRISTGYFYLTGFDLVREDLDQLADPQTLGRAPMRILMGRKTDRQTASEIEEGLSLRQEFKQELREDIEELNRAQIERLDRLRDFIASGLIDVRVRDLRGRLSDVGLKHTDEDRVLREWFRNESGYESLPDWPVEEFVETLSTFLEDYVEESTEYQDTLVGESEVRARLVCWGVIGR